MHVFSRENSNTLRENTEIYIELSFKAVGSVIFVIRVKIFALDFRNLST